MLKHTTFGVIVTAGALLVGFAAPAAAQESQTWDDAADVIKVPVDQPTETLGLTILGVGADQRGCGGRWEANADYATPPKTPRSSRKWFSVTQGERYCRVSRRFLRRIQIDGRAVKVWRVCGAPRSRCRPRARGDRSLLLLLKMRGGPRNDTTMVSLYGYNLRLSQLLTLARSLRPIDSNRPTVEFSHFRTAGGSIKCVGISECYTEDSRFGARVYDEHGSVALCGPPVVALQRPCDPAFIPPLPRRAPTLNDGQMSVYRGYTCAAQGAAVTCTATEGPSAGRGFRIDAGSVALVGPAP